MQFSSLLVIVLISFASHAKTMTCQIEGKKIQVILDKEDRSIKINNKLIPRDKTFEFGRGGDVAEFYKPRSGSLCSDFLAVNINSDSFYVPINHDNATDGQRQALVLILNKKDFALLGSKELRIENDSDILDGQIFFPSNPMLDGSIANQIKIKNTEFQMGEFNLPIWSKLTVTPPDQITLKHDPKMTSQKLPKDFFVRDENELKSLLGWSSQESKFTKTFVFQAKSLDGTTDCFAASNKQSLPKDSEWKCVTKK